MSPRLPVEYNNSDSDSDVAIDSQMTTAMMAALDGHVSVQQELDELKQTLASKAPSRIMQAFRKSVQDIQDSDMLAHAIGVGEVAPHFELLDADNNVVSSHELLQRGPIVLTFFRGGWCEFCSTTLRSLRRYAPHIQARGATLVAVSPQTPEFNKMLQERADLPFAVLSDVGGRLAQSFGVAFEVEESMQGLLAEHGVDLAENQGIKQGEQTGDGNIDGSVATAVLPLPATYIIEASRNRHDDEEGGSDSHDRSSSSISSFGGGGGSGGGGVSLGEPLVTYAFVDADHTQRAEPLEMLAALPRLSRRSRKSLKYKLGLRYSQLQEQGLTDDDVANMLWQMHQQRKALEAAGLVESAKKQGDVLPASSADVLNLLVDARDGKMVKFGKLSKRRGRQHRCSVTSKKVQHSRTGIAARLGLVGSLKSKTMNSSESKTTRSSSSSSGSRSDARREPFGRKGPIILTFLQSADGPFDSIVLEAIDRHYAHFCRHGAASVVAVVPRAPKHDSDGIENGSGSSTSIKIADNHRSTGSWSNVHVLVDEGSQVARQVFGIARDDDMPPMAATFVLDSDCRTVLFAHASPDATKRAEPRDVVGALERLTALSSSSSSSSSGTGTDIVGLASSFEALRGPFSLKLGTWKPFRGLARISKISV